MSDFRIFPSPLSCAHTSTDNPTFQPAGIAFTERMMDPKLTLDGKFAYQKIYQELDYLASGVLTIPPGGEKGLKSSKDNSYVCRTCCAAG